MKDTSRKTKAEPLDARSAEILRSLRDARKAAVKLARIYGAPIVYRKAGKLVRERQ